MYKNPKISIILPTYNSEKTVLETLRSLIGQTYTKLEIIVIDDGSTDNTYKLLLEKSTLDKRIKVFRQTNLGVSAARNLGVKLATGQYIFFMDSDDLLSANCIDILVKSLSDDVLVRSNILSIDSSKKHSSLNEAKNRKFSKDIFLKQLLSGKQNGFSVGTLFDLATIKKTPFKEELSFMEDTIFLVDFIQQSKFKYVIFPEQADYYYVQSSQSVTNSPTKIIKNITNIPKSIDILFDKLSSLDDNSVNKQNRTAKLIENQLQKINSKQLFNDIKQNHEVQNIILDIRNNPNLSFIWLIYFKLYQRINHFYIYKPILFLRTTLKIVKGNLTR